MAIAFPRPYRRHATGLLALSLIAAGVSGCEWATSPTGTLERAGTIPGPSGEIYDLYVQDLAFRGSWVSLSNDPGQAYFVSLGGELVECASTCYDEIRAYENGETPTPAMREHEEHDEADGGSPGGGSPGTPGGT